MSCSKEADPEGYVNIDHQYELKIHQQLTPEGSRPSIFISSIEPQECMNAYISHQTVISDQKMFLILNNILTEGDCEVGSTLINEEIRIDLEATELPLEINVKNIVTNTGTLVSDGSQYDLSLKQFDGLKISKTTINKIQPQMIWGSYSTSENSTDESLSQLLNELDLKDDELKGDYGHFYVAQDNSVSIYDHSTDVHSSFMITIKDDIEKFQSRLLEIKENDPSLVFQATYYNGNSINIE